MAVELEDAKVAYSGAGSTGPFSITFYFLANSHILATKLNAAGTATVLVLTTDYTLTGAADEDGGTLTLVVALAVGETLTIERNVPLTQETNWPTADPFPAASHERAADKLTMIAQQLDARLDRTIRQPTTDTTALNELPIASARASMFLAFDANGQLIVAAGTSGDLSPVSAFVDTLLDDADAAAFLTTLGVSAYIQTLLDDATAETARTTLDVYAKSEVYSKAAVARAGFTLLNGYLDWTVSGNALTAAVKTWAGADPSADDPVYIAFRDATVATGLPVVRTLTAANSITIEDTATLGTINSTAFRLWCVAFDDGGTVRLAAINCLSGTAPSLNIYPLAGWGIASSTLEDNASDAAHVFYSAGAAVTSKAYATLGYATWETGLGTAGTWTTAPERAQLFGPGVPLPGQTVQTQRTQTGAFDSGTTVVPFDDTIPQNTEGDEYMSQAITPSSAANALMLAAMVFASYSAGTRTAVCLFQDSTAGALALSGNENPNVDRNQSIHMTHTMRAGTSASTTFKIRAGGHGAGTLSFNGHTGAGVYGGVISSYLQVAEVMA